MEIRIFHELFELKIKLCDFSQLLSYTRLSSADALPVQNSVNVANKPICGFRVLSLSSL